MPTVQIAHPTAELGDVDEDQIDEWIPYPGMKLLAIPFDTDAYNLANHDRLCGKIFAAINEITNSNEASISAPKPSPEVVLRQRAPISFLIYNLTQPQYQLLLACTIWSSTSITFHVTPLDLVKPNFLFQIQGFTTKLTEQVHNLVANTWHNTETGDFVASILEEAQENEKPSLTHNIRSFLDSAYVTRLDTRDSGNVLAPRYNIYAKSDLISNDTTWSCLRTYLTKCQYVVPMQGQGNTLISPFNCGLCLLLRFVCAGLKR